MKNEVDLRLSIAKSLAIQFNEFWFYKIPDGMGLAGISRFIVEKPFDCFLFTPKSQGLKQETRMGIELKFHKSSGAFQIKDIRKSEKPKHNIRPNQIEGLLKAKRQGLRACFLIGVEFENRNGSEKFIVVIKPEEMKKLWDSDTKEITLQELKKYFMIPWIKKGRVSLWDMKYFLNSKWD